MHMGVENKRDNFSQSTKKKLAKAAGYICSFPLCRLSTRFFVEDNGKLMERSVGEAAHITAAVKGGPRFDPRLTKQARRSCENGIWMCRNHAHYIDVVPDLIPVELLKAWKKKHNADVASGEISLVGALSVDRLWEIRKVSIMGIGPFGAEYSVPLKKFNVLCGTEGSGKTLLCQCICAFAGEGFYKRFSRRFICHNDNARAFIGIDFEHNNGMSSERYEWALKGKRLALQPTSVVSHALFLKNALNAIVVDYEDMCSGRIMMANVVARFSRMLGLTRDEMWAAIEKMGELKTPLNVTIRRDGYCDALVAIGDAELLPFNNLSSGERAFVLVDMALRCLYAAPADQQWIIVVENSIVGRLDDVFRRCIFNALYLSPLNVQVFVCMNTHSEAKKFIHDCIDEFDQEQFRQITVWSADADLYKHEQLRISNEG